MITEFFSQASALLIIVVLIAFAILIAVEIVALYVHLAGFTMLETVLLVAVPLFLYLVALPVVASALLTGDGDATSAVNNISRYVDLPLFRVDNVTMGINLVGFSVPVGISLKMLLQKRVPIKQTVLLVFIIAWLTYLFTRFDPERGIVILKFAILPIVAAGIAFMFKKMKGVGNFNPALLSYVGATLGILLGGDILNVPRALAYPWEQEVFISLGGGSVMDAIFLAGIIALLADLIFRSQEENVIAHLIKRFAEEKHRGD